jgi:hypothetical protein
VLSAVHADPRLVVARHPVKDRFDALWLVNGRVIDWGPLPGPDELASRSTAALSSCSRERQQVPAEEVDEIRIASAWMAEHRPPALDLDQASDPARAERFLRVVRATTSDRSPGVPACGV